MRNWLSEMRSRSDPNVSSWRFIHFSRRSPSWLWRGSLCIFCFPARGFFIAGNQRVSQADNRIALAQIPKWAQHLLGQSRDFEALPNAHNQPSRSARIARPRYSAVTCVKANSSRKIYAVPSLPDRESAGIHNVPALPRTAGGRNHSHHANGFGGHCSNRRSWCDWMVDARAAR